MRELSAHEVMQVAGMFRLNIGQAIAALAFGLIGGGPVGLGYAVSVIIIAQGINNLDEMAQNEGLY